MEEDIREEVTFVILKGKYLLDKRQGGFLDIVKTCLGPKMPLLFTKLYCGANDNGIGLQDGLDPLPWSLGDDLYSQRRKLENIALQCSP